MAKLTVYYSVQGGGDGSAYPKFMESLALAEFDQEHLSESWGESCTGSITFEGDNLKCMSKVESKETYFIDHYCDEYSEGDEEERQEFISKFFPNGLPKFTVTLGKKDGKKYVYNNILVNGVKIAECFRTTAKSGQVFEDFLNGL